MTNTELLNELRDRWLITESNSKFTYYRGLREPDITDPSMGQAAIIKKIFNNKCGAYDGEIRSNTLTLERYLNWTGILIEADPINFSKMLGKKRRAYLSPTCLSIKPRPMTASFLMARNIGRIHQPENFTDIESSNSPDVAHHGTHIIVQCFPLLTFIAAFRFPTVDYLSLDVEGNEMDILETIPFNLVDIKTTIQPFVSEISSFECKMILFHSITDIDANTGRPKNQRAVPKFGGNFLQGSVMLFW
ncbi:hypothetical protein PV325_008638 [Microctonus aethiopoides]|nr:hypothetical protein PV325_008638 [Microctonus aethiopoides]